ncbi:MAG: SLC13 family permease [Pseudohongiellaceae bacterium]
MIDVFPDLPNLHALFALMMMVVALILFTREQIRLEISSLAILIALALAFSLFPFIENGEEFNPTSFFQGFGNEALIAVCALMVLGQGLVSTGALSPVGRALSKAWKISPFLSAFVTLLVSAVLSAFINNTPIVVLLLPILVSVSLRANLPPSKLLMPVGFATIVGGMTTTIGTSTNLLVVSVANDMGLAEIEMFDFFVPASIAACVALIYLWLIAPLLLPEIDIELTDNSHRRFQARLIINEDSPALGKSLAEARELVGKKISFARIRRGDNYLLPLPTVVLLEGDQIRVVDTASKIKEAAEILKATLYSGELLVEDDTSFIADDQIVAEIAIVNGSGIAGLNLGYARFLDQYQLLVLGLHRVGRHDWKDHEEIKDTTLEPGDVLLVQGERESIRNLKLSREFLVLDASEEVPGTRKAPLALATMFGVVLMSALAIVPIAISSMVGAFILLATRSLKIRAAINAINSRVLFVVVASLAIGQSLEVTGASEYLAQVFLFFFQDSSPTFIMSALMLMMGIMTNIVSNNAAAVIGTPIAIGIAQQLGAPPEVFVLAVLFGANLSFATPMSYNTNLLVMSAGNYGFYDFVKVGVPLSILMWLSYSIILSTMYL